MFSYNNKIAQSNLGTGSIATPPTNHPKPRLRRFMHFHTATPQALYWLQWGAPPSSLHPPKIPFLWTDPKTELSTSSVDPSELSSQTASISDAFCHNALDRQTHGPTDGCRECVMTIGRFRSIDSCAA